MLLGDSPMVLPYVDDGKSGENISDVELDVEEEEDEPAYGQGDMELSEDDVESDVSPYTEDDDSETNRNVNSDLVLAEEEAQDDVISNSGDVITLPEEGGEEGVEPYGGRPPAAPSFNVTTSGGLKLTFLRERHILKEKMSILEFHLSSSNFEGPVIEMMSSFKVLLEEVIDRIKQEKQSGPYDKMMACLSSDTVEHFGTSSEPISGFTAALVLAAVQRGSQSERLLELSDNIRIDFKLFHLVTTSVRGGRRKYGNLSNKLYVKERQSLVAIRNDDNMCVSRAVATGIASWKYKKAARLNEGNKLVLKKHFDTLRRDHGKKSAQWKHARSICKRAKISQHNPCGVEEVQKIEKALSINIVIIARDQFNEIVYNGVALSAETEEVPIIYLYRSIGIAGEGAHFDLITDIKHFYNVKYHCEFCQVSYNKPFQHKCADVLAWCYSCNKRCCKLDEEFAVNMRHCDLCNVFFKNSICRDIHFSEAMCEKYYFCMKCYNNVPRIVKKPSGELETNREVKGRHVCVIKCNVCKLDVDALHRCFIQKRPYKDISKRYLFLDFESTQKTGRHVPIFCHLMWCAENEEGEWGWEERSFGLSNDVTDEVGDFIFNSRFKRYTVIAHNMRGYDGCFLLSYIVSRGVKPFVILNGRQIINLIVPVLRIRIIDSLNFLPMKLAGFQKAFGLPEGEKKGFFPHLFINEENFDYIGELPDEEFFATGSMTSGSYKIFKKWFDDYKNSDYIFNFQQELRAYCVQDVKLLQQGCGAFRDLMMRLTDNKCDAFQYITLAGLCAAVYKADHMPIDCIAALPPQGYVDIQPFSSCSLEWLFYQERAFGKTIIHIGNSPTGEPYIVGNIRVDGFEVATKMVYEFYGCFYHACPACYVKRSMRHPLYGITYQAVYEKTKMKETRLRLLNYNLKTIWECQWRKMKQENSEIVSLLCDNLERLKPINPHDSFFGGRVEIFKMLVDDNESRLNYVDVNSLYPSVNLLADYPIGHPRVLFNDFGDLKDIPDRVFGFMYCKVLPPTHLYIPVLPGKYGGDNKLLFTLCRTCASATPRVAGKCEHSSDERALTGTWFSEEIRVAQSVGYEVLEVYAAYHFETKSDKLFETYIKKFYKIKLISSGIPDGCVTPESLNVFKRRILEREGVDLFGDDFSDNPGMRSVAKLMLNSLWGKFGTRLIRSQHSFCSSIEDLSEIMLDEKNVVTNVIEMSENIVLAVYESKGLEYLGLNNVNNVYIASCTTAWARIRLYEYLSKVNERAVYCDTDSIIYVDQPGDNLPLGDFLGELKSELPKDTFIIQFCSIAPKVYGYIFGDVSKARGYIKLGAALKVKGFRINASTEAAFSFENMKQVIMKFSENDFDEASAYIRIKTSKELSVIMKQKKLVSIEGHMKTPQKVSSYVDSEHLSIYNPLVFHKTSTWEIINREEHKIFICNYDKRMVNAETLDTLPFGFL